MERYLNAYQMVKHFSMKWIFLHMSKAYYIKHITDSGQKFLALVIPKSWRYTVLVEVHDKLGHQGNHPHLLPHQMLVLLERNE